MNEGLLVPAFTLLTFHWYAGEGPPLTVEAVKVTLVPIHTGFSAATIETPTGGAGVSAMVMGPEVAGFPDTQDTFDVITQTTASFSFGT